MSPPGNRVPGLGDGGDPLAEDRPVEPLHGPAGDLGEQVAAAAHGGGDRGVAHLLLDELQVLPRGDHQGGVGVAEVVEADAPQAGPPQGGLELPLNAPETGSRKGTRYGSSWMRW